MENILGLQYKPCKITKFMDDFSHIMTPEDRRKLENIYEKLERLRSLKKITNRHGEHYEDCRWSDEKITCGPDTCKCFRNSIESHEADAEKIMNVYFYIYNKIKDTA